MEKEPIQTITVRHAIDTIFTYNRHSKVVEAHTIVSSVTKTLFDMTDDEDWPHAVMVGTKVERGFDGISLDEGEVVLKFYERHRGSLDDVVVQYTKEGKWFLEGKELTTIKDGYNFICNLDTPGILDKATKLGHFYAEVATRARRDKIFIDLLDEEENDLMKSLLHAVTISHSEKL